MSLNLNTPPDKSHSKFPDRPLPKAGPQPARVAMVIDLGIQTRPPFKGKEKTPAHQVFVNFELVNDTYEVEGKLVNHRVGPKPFNIVSKNSEMYGNSGIAKFLAAIDPAGTINGDLTALADKPCLTTVVHTDGVNQHLGKKFANIGQIIQAPEGFPVKPLSSPAVIFSFESPTEDAWKAIPKFLQEKIKTALNYKGSKVEEIVSKVPA